MGAGAAAGGVQARRYAGERNSALAVHSKYDVAPDLVLYYKRLMVLEGHSAYEHQLNATDKLSPSQQAFLDEQWKQFRTWWEQWEGK